MRVHEQDIRKFFQAAKYVALVARQHQLKGLIQEKEEELKCLDMQKSTGNIQLGQNMYEQHVLCSRQDKLHELHTFYRDTVLLQILNSQAQQYNRKPVWSWIDSNPLIWRDWDSLLEYARSPPGRNTKPTFAVLGDLWLYGCLSRWGWTSNQHFGDR